MEDNDEVLNTANHGEWSLDYESLIKEIKKKREEIKRKRNNPFGHVILPMAMKVSAQTIGLNLVSVQPLSPPNGIIFTMDYYYEDPKAKYKKRKRVVDKLLGKEEEKEDHLTFFNGELSHPDNTNFTIDTKDDNSSNVYNVMSKWASLIESTKNDDKMNWLNEYVNQHAKYENSSSGLGV